MTPVLVYIRSVKSVQKESEWLWRKRIVKEMGLIKSGVKGRGSDRWWERRWGLWWGDAHRMRWTRSEESEQDYLDRTKKGANSNLVIWSDEDSDYRIRHYPVFIKYLSLIDYRWRCSKVLCLCITWCCRSMLLPLYKLNEEWFLCAV